MAALHPDADAERLATLVDSIRPSPPERPPSPYEDPEFHRIMCDLADGVERAAVEAGFITSSFARPFLATLDTGRIHAFTTVVPGSQERVVFFESELFIFALLLSKAVCRAIPLDAAQAAPTKMLTTADVASRLAQDRSIVRRFQEVVVAYALTGLCGNAPAYLVDEQSILFVDSLLDSLLTFVLGHEYGHILAGHFSEVALQQAASLEAADAVALAWAKEVSADMIAVRLALPPLDSASALDIAICYWGADFFFSAIDIMDRAVSLLATGVEDNLTLGSHPPHEYRRKIARDVLVSTVGKDLAVLAVNQGRVVEVILALLWQDTRKLLRHAHEQGYRPAPKWTAGQPGRSQLM
jgi:hypothetical protein